MEKYKLMAHLVAMYPNKKIALAVADSLIKGGASFLEIQFPFSDPSADGPIIQTACAKTIENGFKVEEGFSFIKDIKNKYADIPVFIMTYASIAYKTGIENFANMAKKSGADGLIIPDLPFDSDEGLNEACKKNGIASVPVAALSMTEDRLSKLIALKREYIYAALRLGITGSKTSIDKKTIDFLEKLKESKVLGGFGIRTNEQVWELSKYVYSAVAGSVFVEIITKVCFEKGYDIKKDEENIIKEVTKAIEDKAREIIGL